MSRSLFVFLFIVCLVACKERLVEVPEPKPDPALSWQVSDAFLFDLKNQLTSYADSNLVILSGSQTTSIALNRNGSNPDTSFRHYGGQAQPYGRTDYRPLLRPAYMGFTLDDVLNFVPTASPVQSYVNTYVRMASIDKDFASFQLIPAFAGNALVANRQNQIIVPYRQYDRSYATPVLKGSIQLALISLNVPVPPSLALSTRQVKTFQLENTSFIYNMCSVGDYFILSTSNGIYRVAPDGTFEKTNTQLMPRLFVYKSDLYGIAQAFSDGVNSNQLLVSKDEGRTWTVLSSSLSTTYGFLYFQQVGDELIASYNSQLFQLTLTPTTLTTTELDNTGLYGNRITSVAQFRNTVYVSTLSGVFTKPVRTFLTPKKDK